MLERLFKNRMVKSLEEIELIRESSLLVSKTLTEIAKIIRPGITGLEIDAIAETFIKDHGAKPAFKGYGGFPNSLCISINDAVVHGIPTNEAFKDGDIVSVDCGTILNAYHGDHAYTFAIGNVEEEVMKLLRVTHQSLYLGIENAIVGKRTGDIGYAIQQYCEKENGYGVVRELVGHGLGKELHEDPEIPNYGRRGQKTKLVENMVLAIEPMINLGTRKIMTLQDDWTVVTQDRKPSAHFEHNVVVKKDKAEILSNFEMIEDVIKKNIELQTVV